eukprot:scaffold2430_cov163-Skeletonema_marinoi.AAC.5
MTRHRVITGTSVQPTRSPKKVNQKFWSLHFFVLFIVPTIYLNDGARLSSSRSRSAICQQPANNIAVEALRY